MFKSCKYCGKIHDVKYECLSKPKRKYIQNKYSEKNAEIKKFRSSAKWQKKAAEIKQRDLHLCSICMRELYNTIDKYTYDNTEVHHIIPLASDFNRRLDNYNLITLCKMHHVMADLGQIPIDVLLEVVMEQEKVSNPPHKGDLLL